MRDRPPLEAAYLMAGTDRPKVQRAVARLRQRVLDEAGSDLNVVSFDAETVPVSAVLEAAQTPGLILGTRLLVVTNAHKWPAKSRQALAAYVKDPLPETCLAVEGVSFTEADQLRKAIAEHGTVLIWDLPKRYEMAGWVRERAQAHGIVMGTAAARHFLERCGMEATHGERLEREIEKLAAYCSGGEASIADIDEICTPDDEARIFSLIDAVGDRARVRAFELLEAVYLSGDEPSKILYLLLRHVDELNGALNLETNDPRAIAKRLGMPFWKARRLAAQLAQYDRRRLGHAYAVLAAAEAGLRGRAPATLETDAGINHSDRLVLELALGRLLS